MATNHSKYLAGSLKRTHLKIKRKGAKLQKVTVAAYVIYNYFFVSLRLCVY
jgi:hypothetical protein